MTFKILSKRRNKNKFMINLLLLILFGMLGFIVIKTDDLSAKILLFIIILFFITPLSLVRNKTIGNFELDENCIRFITQQGELVRLNLLDITFCKLEYGSYKGNIHFMAGGWSWESGVNQFEIEAKEKKYEILFLSESMKDVDKIFQYIDILKKNNISYHFEMNGRTFESLS